MIPRVLGGIDSITRLAPSPHSPPIAKPNSARMTSSTTRLGAKAEANSNTENSSDVDHQDRPAAVFLGEPAEEQRAERPRRQRQRHAGERPRHDRNGIRCAIASIMNTIRKKSNASSVQPRKLAITALHWLRSSVPSSARSPILSAFLLVSASHASIDGRRCTSRASPSPISAPIADARSRPAPGFVVLTGENGAGKTNILEAVSLLAPGRGLRGAALSEMARGDGPGGFAVAARLASEAGEDVEIGTGASAAAPERRQVRINGATASAAALVRMAVDPVADPGDGPAVQRGGERPAALPRPAGARARARPRPPRRALRGGDARAQQAARRAGRRRPGLAGRARGGDGRAWRGDRRGARADGGGARRAAGRRRPTARSRAPGSRSTAGGRARRRSLAELRAVARARRRGGAHAGRAAPLRSRGHPCRQGASPPSAARPASRRRCCSASCSRMPSSSPSAPAGRRCCCSTRSPRISIRCAARPCSIGSRRWRRRSG